MDNLFFRGNAKSMKTVFYTISYYVLTVLLGSLAAALVYMVCCDLTVLVAGEKLVFFCGDFFFRGIFASFPLVVCIALFLVVFYGIRHLKKNLWIMCTYVLLCALSWLLLIPLMFNLEQAYKEKYSTEYEISNLSPGFFRKDSGGIFYFSRVSDDGKADGLFIDLSGITGEAGTVSRFSGMKTLSDEKEFKSEFADSVIRDSTKLPFAVSAPLNVYLILLEKARTAWAGGCARYVMFLAFALALSASASLQYVSTWRLVNGLISVLAGAAVCVFNYAYYLGFVFKTAAVSWDAYFSSIAVGKNGFWESLLSSGGILLAVVNLAFFVILLASGIFLYIFKGKKMIKKQEE